MGGCCLENAAFAVQHRQLSNYVVVDVINFHTFTTSACSAVSSNITAEADHHRDKQAVTSLRTSSRFSEQLEASRCDTAWVLLRVAAQWMP